MDTQEAGETREEALAIFHKTMEVVAHRALMVGMLIGAAALASGVCIGHWFFNKK